MVSYLQIALQCLNDIMSSSQNGDKMVQGNSSGTTHSMHTIHNYNLQHHLFLLNLLSMYVSCHFRFYFRLHDIQPDEWPQQHHRRDNPLQRRSAARAQAGAGLHQPHVPRNVHRGHLGREHHCADARVQHQCGHGVL